MTFETARMRTGSETLLSSKLQLTQAMRALSAVVGVAQSATVVIPRIDCRILRSEVVKKKSKMAIARMPTIDIYLGPMPGAIGIVC